MQNSYEHLSSERQSQAKMPDDERIKVIIREKWVRLPQAEGVVDRLEDLLKYPKRSRQLNLLLYGPTDAGKSSILNRFRHLHPATFDEKDGAGNCPVVRFDITNDDSEEAFFLDMLECMSVDINLGYGKRRARKLAFDMAKTLSVRMVILDELNQILTRTIKQQHNFLGCLRNMMNAMGIPIVCAGTNEARIALLRDEHLADRFGSIQLRSWKLDANFERFIASFSSSLPLRKPSKMHNEPFQKRVMEITAGVTGRVFFLMEALAIEAIKSGQEMIDLDLLNKPDLILPLVAMEDRAERQSRIAKGL
jgi:Bacterial TniB protein